MVREISITSARLLCLFFFVCLFVMFFFPFLVFGFLGSSFFRKNFVVVAPIQIGATAITTLAGMGVHAGR